MRTNNNSHNPVTPRQVAAFEAAIRGYEAFGRASGLEEIALHDAPRLRAVLGLVMGGRLDEAAALTRRLDTAVRDRIPSAVYDAMFTRRTGA